MITEHLPAPATLAAKYVPTTGRASVVTAQLAVGYVRLYRAVPADQQDDLVVPCRLMLDIQAVRFEFKSRAAFMPKGRILA